ncbi:MAG TPA: signal peptidase I [Candidatus Limnocylindrales bacterium]|nr:signal peptidase I [Candidatus Limnocylindrales bacterium]
MTEANELLEPGPVSDRRPRARGRLFEVVETVALTVVIFLVIQTFVAQPYQVQMTSMENTFLPGHYVLVDKLTPRWAPYLRGDIVVFDPPEAATSDRLDPFIKRVIGAPGDTVALQDGKVLVNGIELDEPYLFTGSDGNQEPTDPEGGGTEWVVAEGQLFVMGDHRQASSDSRSFGPIEIGNVIGRAWLRYWPFDAFGLIERP